MFNAILSLSADLTQEDESLAFYNASYIYLHVSL